MTMLKMLLPLFLFWSSGISLVNTPDVISFSYTVGEWNTVVINGCMMNSVDITDNVRNQPKFSVGTVVCVRSDDKTEYFIAAAEENKQNYHHGKPSNGYLRFSFSENALGDYASNMSFLNYVSYGRPESIGFLDKQYSNNINDEAWYLYGAFLEQSNQLYVLNDEIGLGGHNNGYWSNKKNDPAASGTKWKKVEKQYPSWEAFINSGKLSEKHATVKHKGYWYTTAHVDYELKDDDLKLRAKIEPGKEGSYGYWNRIGDIRYQKYNKYQEKNSDILVFELSNGEHYVGSINNYCKAYKNSSAGFVRIKECK